MPLKLHSILKRVTVPAAILLLAAGAAFFALGGPGLIESARGPAVPFDRAVRL